jgi:beta-lactam-binding protein with PASTA domain
MDLSRLSPSSIAHTMAIALLCVTAAHGATQTVPCDQVTPSERELARSLGRCVERPSAPRAIEKLAPGAIDRLAPRAIEKPAAPVEKPAVNLRERAATPRTPIRPPIEAAVPTPACAPLPNLASLPYDRALHAIDPKLFRPRRFEEHSSLARNTVVRQSTERLEGRVCWANLWVSDGSLVKVPSLAGATRDEAARRLQAVQLGISVFDQPSSETPGRVFAQNPMPNTEVRRESTVRVAVAQPARERGDSPPPRQPPREPPVQPPRQPPQIPPQPPPRSPQPAPPPVAEYFPVPNVVGMQYGEALTALRPFNVNSSEAVSANTKGEVIAQSPPAHTRQRIKDPVSVQVSDGSLVRVPPLVGATREDAAQKLRASQLRVAVAETPSTERAGHVLSQNPRAETEVSRNSTVRVTIAQSILVRVPPLIGATREEAAQKLAAAQLAIEVEEAPSTQPAGQVFTQVPGPNSEVQRRSKVKVTIATPLEIVLAPPLAGTDPPGSPPTATQPSDPAPTEKPAPIAAAIPDSSVPPPGERPPLHPLWYLVGAATFLAAQVLVWRHFRAKPKTHAPAAPTRVTARIESSFADTHVEGARPVGPNVRVAVRIDAAAVEDRITEGALP